MHFEIYFDLFQQYRWRMLDEGGAEIAVSPQGYYNKLACERYVDLMRAHAAAADVQDRTAGIVPPARIERS
jgi:uncharacterized protein YegP (UPF0339 family)